MSQYQSLVVRIDAVADALGWRAEPQVIAANVRNTYRHWDIGTIDVWTSPEGEFLHANITFEDAAMFTRNFQDVTNALYRVLHDTPA